MCWGHLANDAEHLRLTPEAILTFFFKTRMGTQEIVETCDLTGVSLTGVSLTSVSLTSVSLSGVSLTGVSLTGVCFAWERTRALQRACLRACACMYGVHFLGQTQER